MEPPAVTAANAQQNANVAVRDVLSPLQIASPNKPFCLGGVASLALFALSAEERGRPLSIQLILQTAALPLNRAPLIVHLPPNVDEAQAAKEQRDFAAGADHGNSSRSLQHPFNTSLFLQPLPARGGGEVNYLMHLRLLSLPIAPRAFDRLVHRISFNGHTVRSLSWPALVAEQLFLGAETSQITGTEAAFVVIRWATLAGRNEIDAAQDLQRDGHISRLPFESVTLGIAEAVHGMLWTEEGDAVIDVWLGRLDDKAFAGKVCRWEWNHCPVVRQHIEYEELLEQYVGIKGMLQRILEEARANHPRRQQERSLAKSAFAPASRGRGEQMAVFA
ncbi:hypothetical protein JCM10450v2_001622 [Rhodotorula kratochvilovae]